MDGEELKTRRERLGMSQQELADRLGVRRQTIGEWETGVRAIRLGVILGLALDMLEHDQGERETAADDD